MKIGIVGLPNVGKSTLFNALTATASAEAANYPFCTIEPNVGLVGVPDERLDQLAAIVKPQRILPTQIEFVDIAGLVRGASKGEGLGNQFLAHIREVDAIVQVLRCFEGDVTHVEGSVDPLRDKEVIETELMLADLESLEKRIINLEKKARGKDIEATEMLEAAKAARLVLEDGQPASTAVVDEPQALKNLQLLTTKPVLYVCNVEEENAATGNALSEKVASVVDNSVVISAAIEAEIAVLEEGKEEFLEELNLTEAGLSKLIRASYKLLGLQTYFTAGEKEVRAWTIKQGFTAPQAAGVIHTDFQRGFIKADVISFNDYMQHNGEASAKEAGKLRQEGKEYTVADGDVIHFKFNV